MAGVSDDGGAVVETATVGPGHDGRAVLVVGLRHPDGATSTISLDEEALGALLAEGTVTSVEDLPGRRWADLIAAR